MKLLNVLEQLSNEIMYFIDTETTYHDERGIIPLDSDKSDLTKARAEQLALEVIAKLSNALLKEL